MRYLRAGLRKKANNRHHASLWHITNRRRPRAPLIVSLGSGPNGSYCSKSFDVHKLGAMLFMYHMPQKLSTNRGSNRVV
jgi:hypothetical protein